MKRPWLYYISPFTLLALFSVVFLVMALAEINKHESYSIVEVFVYAIAILLLIVFDIVIKQTTNGKILYIWIIEAVIVALLYYLLNSSFRLSGC